MTIHRFGDCHPCLAQGSEVSIQGRVGKWQITLEARAPAEGRGFPHRPAQLPFTVFYNVPDKASLNTGPLAFPQSRCWSSRIWWENGLLRAPAEVHAPPGLRSC